MREAGRTLLKVKNNVNFGEIKNYGAVVSEKYGGKEAAGFFGGGYDIDRRGLGDNQTDDQRVMGATDDVRPTAPGHSPGAGHSRGPSSVDPNQ
ncbi:hypothetical protein TIFTF001_009288 [Ficus carica]|uniref:Uncharacterized protein n=1 Tax=Ficus carica TaxID=3494 RepID=A0AA87ZV07_FICCA|nr:hypothetical protein TIFTF001_009288 [Ficus carica]